MIEIVADISGNHGGDITKAVQLIRMAAWAGCDYAKFQYYRVEDMPDANVEYNRILYRKLAVPELWLPVLFEEAKKNHIGLFASVFSVRAVYELLKYDVPYIKIASPESTRLSEKTYYDIFHAIPLRTRFIISSGMADRFEMKKWAPHRFLYCPPGHPQPMTDEDAMGMKWDLAGFDGFSDHSTGYSNALTMIEYGARMVEKHIKLDDNCEDALFSADPQTMKTLCRLAKG